MSAFTASSNGNLLRRGLLGPLSQRNVSAANVCLAQKSEKHSDGFLSKLKDIFNRSAVLESYKNHTSSDEMDQYGTVLHYDQAIQGLSGLDRHSLRLIRCRINPHSIGYDRGMTAMSWMGEPIGLSSRNTKPPIREPNMPEKPKKEEKKEKKQKKPVIRVDSADEVTNILEPVRKEISNSDETNYNCQWGVKLTESTVNSDKPVLRNIPEYVIKQKWGVNVKEYLTKAEAAAIATSEAKPKETAKDTQEVNANYVNVGSASNARTGTRVTSGDALQSPLQLKNIQVHQAGDSLEASNRRTTDSTGNDISKDMENDDRSIAERAENQSEKSESIEKDIRDSKQFERCLDCDYNIPENIPSGGEISAWEDVAVKSKIRERSFAASKASAKPTKSSGRIFIRPEPPEPKLDIETVRATNEWDDIVDEVNRSEYKALRSMEIKRALNRMDPLSAFRKIDYTTQKKLHTYSTCSPYTLYLDNSLPVNKIIRTRMKINTVSSAGSNSRKEFNTELGKIRKIARNQNPIEQLEVQSPIDLESLTTQPKLSTVVTGMLQSDQEETKSQLTVKDSGATVDKIEDNEALLQKDSNLLSQEREAEMVLAISSNEDASDDQVNSNEDLEHDESTESDGPVEALLSKEISSDSEEKSFLNFDTPKKSISLRVPSESAESSELLVNEEHSTASSWHNRNDLKEKYELSNSQEEEGYEEDDEFIIDGDFIRMPGDPYPYSRDNIKRWQVPSGKGISKEDSVQPPLSTSTNEPVRTYDNYKVSEFTNSPNSERAATQFSDSRHRMETDSIQHQAPIRKMSRSTQKEKKTSSISKLSDLSEAREHSPLRYYKTAIESHLVPHCLRNNSKQNFSTNQQNSSLRGNPILSPRAIYAESYLFNIDRRSILNDNTETESQERATEIKDRIDGSEEFEEPMKPKISPDDHPWSEQEGDRDPEVTDRSVKIFGNDVDIIGAQTIHPDISPPVGDENLQNLLESEISHLVEKPLTLKGKTINKDPSWINEHNEFINKRREKLLPISDQHSLEYFGVTWTQLTGKMEPCVNPSNKEIHESRNHRGSRSVDLQVCSGSATDSSIGFVESPRTLAKRIENFVTENAWSEEIRAQKVLILLHARDQQIAHLQKRVAELEDTAANLHAVGIRESSVSSGNETLGNDTSYLSIPGSVQFIKKFCYCEEGTSKSKHELSQSSKDSVIEASDDRNHLAESASKRSSVPKLKLQSSRTSVSDKDPFSTVTDRPGFLGDPCCEMKSPEKSNVPIDRGDGLGFARNKKLNSSNVSLQAEPKSRYPARISSSVPWMRTKRSLRRKSRGCRGFELGLKREDGVSQYHPRKISGIVSGTMASYRLNPERSAGQSGRSCQKQQKAKKLVHEDAQEARLILDQDISVRMKSASTQTIVVDMNSGKRSLDICQAKVLKIVASQRSYPDESKWDLDDPAPQWLIAEALDKEREKSQTDQADCVKDIAENNGSLTMRYENIVLEMEGKLEDAKAQLKESLKRNYLIKEKYRRALRNIKLEAARENEILQGKVVNIYSSILQKFAPNRKRKVARPTKYHKQLKSFRTFSKKMNTKFRRILLASNKLNQELLLSRKALAEKTTQYESLNNCFAKLKHELETAEVNLNGLIKENSSLRKKFEDTREWIELKIGKERHEKSNFAQYKEMQRNREFRNMKNKAEEDFAAITQLRNKLLRSESANANKGFLLNSYKSQLADMTKEKDEYVVKFKELENDMAVLRNNNGQLKAKISLLSNEKDKLLFESEKMEKLQSDVKDKLENRLTSKNEKSVLHEMDAMKAKSDEVVRILKSKLNASETCNAEYFVAIKEFLKEIHEWQTELEAVEKLSSSEASEREAHETACAILNITRGQLSKFMKEKSPNTVNSWLLDFHKITAKTNFSQALSKFLIKKVTEQRK